VLVLTCGDADLRADMAKIDVPVAIFHGVVDKVVPFELAEVLHQGIPGSKLIQFEQSGHGLFYDEVEKFNPELMQFAGNPYSKL
jgi:non-heme chloroperoxidase